MEKEKHGQFMVGELLMVKELMTKNNKPFKWLQLLVRNDDGGASVKNVYDYGNGNYTGSLGKDIKVDFWVRGYPVNDGKDVRIKFMVLNASRGNGNGKAPY